MHTIEVLMNQMNMMYYWEKIRLYFRNHEPSLEQLSKLMNRILKLYLMIDNFMKVFKMIDKLDVSLQSINSNLILIFIETERIAIEN